MTIAEGLAQDLDDIIDEVESITGLRPVFMQWTSHKGVQCRLYNMGDGTCSKLWLEESETAIVDYRWIDEK